MYVASQTLLGWLNSRKKKREIDTWRQETLPDLILNHKASLQKILGRAGERAKKLEKRGLVILKAYYGLRSDIKKYIDLRLMPDGEVKIPE